MRLGGMIEAISRSVDQEGVRVYVFQHRFRLMDIGILSRRDVDLRRIAKGITNGMGFCDQIRSGMTG
ncbi:MAG: hypothetical protein GX413_10040 [Acetobacter sp.]|nr:hypothetical protein [Acetobacter sp.]